MKTFLSTVLFLVSFNMSHSQNIKKIESEGVLLYRLEKASWYASDLLMDTYDLLIDSAGGYVSYVNDNDEVVTVIYDKEDPSLILLRFTFDQIPQPEPKNTEPIPSEATPIEKELISIRQLVMQEMESNNDNFFRFYRKTQPNVVPLITKKSRKAFVLTGTTEPNTVLIGNDYELIFSKKNRIKKKRMLHKSLISYEFRSSTGKPLVSTMHSHVVTDLITATDICTLLLYKDFLEWDKHYVFGKKYISLFDLKTETLSILKRKNWEKNLEHSTDKN